MTSEDTKKLEYDQYQKSDKAPFAIYADLECTIEKIGEWKNNHENSSKTKVGDHFPSGFISIIMITRKVKINLKDMQQSPDYNIVYNQGKIKMLK